MYTKCIYQGVFLCLLVVLVINENIKASDGYIDSILGRSRGHKK